MVPACGDAARTGRGGVGWFSIGLALVALGACSPPWSVVRETPGALAGVTTLQLSPIAFDEVEVDGVERSSLPADAQRELSALTREIDAVFGAALESECAQSGIRIDRYGAANGAPRVVPRAVELWRGAYAYDAATRSRLALAVAVVAPSGAPLEEIAVERGSQAEAANPTAAGRLRDDARALASMVAEYLRHRIGEER